MPKKLDAHHTLHRRNTFSPRSGARGSNGPQPANRAAAEATSGKAAAWLHFNRRESERRGREPCNSGDAGELVDES